MWLYGAAWVRAAFLERGTEEQVELVERGQRSWWQARCRGLRLGAGWLRRWGAASSCLWAAEEVVFRTKICMDGISSLSDSG